MQELPQGQSVRLLEQLQNSLQTVFLAKLPLPDSDAGQGHKKKKRKKKKKHQELSESNTEEEAVSCEISECFAAALSRGVSLFSLVLLHTPVSVWSGEGLQRGKAMAALTGAYRDVCLPLMRAARTIVRARATVHVYTCTVECSA